MPAWRDRIRELRRVRAGDLIPHPKNFRRHPPAQRAALEAVLDNVGLADALIARETPEGLQLVDGHLRADIDAEAEVPVLIVDLDEHEADVVLATLDPLAAMAQQDNERLEALLGDLREQDRHLVAFLAGAEDPGEPDVDEVPEPPADPVTRPGDLWRLGDHVLVCGDARDPELVTRVTTGAQIDLIVTSPPYNVGIGYDAHNDAQAPREAYLGFLREVLACWVPALQDGRFVAWNVGASPKTHHHHQALLLEDVGLTYRRQIVWAKPGVPLPTFHVTERASRARVYTPDFCHELIFLASKGEPAKGPPIELPEHGSSDVWNHIHQSQATRDIPKVEHDGRGQDGFHDWNQGHAYPASKRKAAAHPAVFPVALPATAIGFLTAPGELVCDPFAGAGTTMVACEQLGRRSIGIELSPAYCDVAVQRWERMTGKTAERAS